MIRLDKNALAIFNPKTGTKLRLVAGKYTKSKRPELVDIKITDYCVFNCAGCYQGSTIDGKHSTLENMKFIIDELSKAKVFEVAYGGGEPTDHPDFLEILAYTKAKNIVPNFTTKSMGWVKRNWKEIEPLIGAFAFSADSAKHIDSAAKMFKDIPKHKVNLHCVMGLHTEQQFVEYLLAAHEHDLRVTLLGYKTTGRGADLDPINYDYWIDVVNWLVSEGKCASLSIDTPLAQQYDGFMPVKQMSYHTKEGFVSAYIDAVAMRLGASSWEAQDELKTFDKNWIKTYATIRPR